METTKVVIAQPKSGSLRTTIPASIARTLGITEDTELGWELQPKESEFVLIVHVLQPSPPVRPAHRKAQRGKER